MSHDNKRQMRLNNTSVGPPHEHLQTKNAYIPVDQRDGDPRYATPRNLASGLVKLGFDLADTSRVDQMSDQTERMRYERDEAVARADEAIARAEKAEQSFRQIREAARDVINALILPGHSIEDAWDELCLLTGCYCDPYLGSGPKILADIVAADATRRTVDE